jgi:hypothetical protein
VTPDLHGMILRWLDQQVINSADPRHRRRCRAGRYRRPGAAVA